MTLPTTDERQSLLQDGMLGCRVEWLLSLNGSQVLPVWEWQGLNTLMGWMAGPTIYYHCHAGIGGGPERRCGWMVSICREGPISCVEIKVSGAISGGCCAQGESVLARTQTGVS